MPASSGAVGFDNTGSGTVGSTAGLVFDEKPKKMKQRLLYGLLGVLAMLVIALVVAVIVLASRDNGESTSSKADNAQSDGQTDGWVTPDCPANPSAANPNLEKAKCILASYPLVDGHNDLPYRYRMYSNNSVNTVDLKADLSIAWHENFSQTDIPRLRTGMLGAQFWADYVPCDSQYKDAVRLSLEQLDTIKRYVDKYQDTFEFVTTAQGILDAFRKRKIGSLIGLEGGHSIDSSLPTLRMFYTLGVRYMTITHSCNTPWADNWLADTPDYNETKEGPKHGGLTAFGEVVIKEMNRIGMLVDLSHVAKDTMIDALRVARAPVIYSHSSAFSYCNHYRNVQDDVLRMTRDNGGVVMVNFYDKYINCYPNNKTVATLEQVADHIDYIKDQIGVDFVAIGADYDGVPTLPKDLEDASTYPALFAELVRRGWSDENLQKLAGKNLIRAFTKAEQVRDEMAYMPPYEDIIPDEGRNRGNACSTDF